jgi:hypothetical protein
MDPLLAMLLERVAVALVIAAALSTLARAHVHRASTRGDAP